MTARHDATVVVDASHDPVADRDVEHAMAVAIRTGPYVDVGQRQPRPDVGQVEWREDAEAHECGVEFAIVVARGKHETAKCFWSRRAEHVCVSTRRVPRLRTAPFTILRLRPADDSY